MANPALDRLVQRALQRREQIPQLSQVSQEAPVANQPQQPVAQSEMTQQSEPQPQAGAPANSESEMIIKALIDRLKMNQGGGSAEDPTYSDKGYGGGLPYKQ